MKTCNFTFCFERKASYIRFRINLGKGMNSGKLRKKQETVRVLLLFEPRP